MHIIKVKSAVFDEIKVIRFNRLLDDRGFFSEIYKKSDFQNNAKLSFLQQKELKQANISYSKANVIRGLHFQLKPQMDKLVRVMKGAMIDLFLDVRIGSPSFGKIGGYLISTTVKNKFNEWIFVPSGFAHGAIFLRPTIMEYFCTEEYCPDTEKTVSLVAKDIDWSSFDKN